MHAICTPAKGVETNLQQLSKHKKNRHGVMIGLGLCICDGTSNWEGHVYLTGEALASCLVHGVSICSWESLAERLCRFLFFIFKSSKSSFEPRLIMAISLRRCDWDGGDCAPYVMYPHACIYDTNMACDRNIWNRQQHSVMCDSMMCHVWKQQNWYQCVTTTKLAPMHHQTCFVFTEHMKFTAM